MSKTMKPNRTYLFIIISSIALAIVLVIQCNWILQTARIKEKVFNDNANMVLSKTAEALHTDQDMFSRLQISLQQSEADKIDSLLKHYMQVYNIHINYNFEVTPAPASINNISGFVLNNKANKEGAYQACISGDAKQNSVDLMLTFPDKEAFIRAEMGIPFITSVILIFLVLVMSWHTVHSLVKEKRISEQTTEFLNNMTHEFKTPLTNIALAGKMLEKEVQPFLHDKGKRYSEIILQENEKLRLQVEHMLGMAALERGELPMDKREVDMHQLIHDALKTMSIQIEGLQGSVKHELEAERFTVRGDKVHLTNVLCNLVDNAIKYAKDKPDIVIHTSNDGSDLILSVSDNGVGIEKEHQSKVFDKFFRVSSGDVHDVKGFGLGLAYVKKIVELHGGSIRLRSRKGNGATFTIVLPYV
ncbi:MAG: HAMP domain-containing histidine kinase [Flavobacteriales bacterium]|nr:HAMP domain-containing histidine kinase [Flavobacteriales bacterium]